MTSASPPAGMRRRPPGRYDEPSRVGARVLAVVLSLLFLAMLAAIATVLWTRYGPDRVAVQDRGFEVLSDDAVRVEFAATAPDGRTVWCLVRARSADGAEVGARFVRVLPGDGSGPVEVAYTLPTTARAVTGEVPRCTLGDPPAGTPTDQPDP